MFDPPALPTTSYPRTLLSEAARRRLDDAHGEADSIRSQAIADVALRYRSESDCELSLSEYMGTGQAYIDLKQSDLEAARAVLAVAVEVYREVSDSWKQFSHALGQEIESACYSLELSDFQRRALEHQFIYRNLSPVQTQPAPAPLEAAAEPQLNSAPKPPPVTAHEERLAKIDAHYGAGKRPESEFYRGLNLTSSEYYAWKREDHSHCGRSKRKKLEKAADKLSSK